MNRFVREVYEEIKPGKAIYFISANLIALFVMSVTFYVISITYQVNSRPIIFGTSIFLGSIPIILVFYYRFFALKTKEFSYETSLGEEGVFVIIGGNGSGKTAVLRNILSPAQERRTLDTLYWDLIRICKLAIERGDKDSAMEIIAMIHRLGNVAIEEGVREVAERAALSLEIIGKIIVREKLEESEYSAGLKNLRDELKEKILGSGD